MGTSARVCVMTSPSRFTYPFCYVPHPLVVDAARSLIQRLDSDPSLGSLFSEGKMMGVLLTDSGPLYAFSGLAGGKAVIDGFVPPVYDLTQGYYKEREAEISSMSAGPARSEASAMLQEWIFRQYRVMNALGDELSVLDIFARRGLVPPGGTGDCAAPKLLNYAFRNGLKPLAMGEFWYGKSPVREVREQGRFYPSCTGKCGPLLSWMMQGLNIEPNPLDSAVASPAVPDVLYVDDDIIVVDKPSGMLSVPGKIESESMLEWLRKRFGRTVESCHRLDMDTSGIMVFARSLKAKAELERQFATREVSKLYRARLEGGPWNHAMKGTIALPLMLDYYDRPRQMVDYDAGKRAVTEYEVIQILPDGTVDVIFKPLTGRSHQIRVHAAHYRGLGHPIVGDRLYGSAAEGRQLMLRACGLAFKHPADGRCMSFGERI
ncbi:MAG: RluA family pseudouridine synthase [Bacteroidales bacterium]|nr:RluA family pseudouridine synthase [Bacteroidales bacterium]